METEQSMEVQVLLTKDINLPIVKWHHPHLDMSKIRGIRENKIIK
jgi:hypothetical protein